MAIDSNTLWAPNPYVIRVGTGPIVSAFAELEKLRARTAPTKREVPKRAKAVTDRELLVLLDEFKTELKKKDERIEKLEKRMASAALALQGNGAATIEGLSNVQVRY